jgi:hypothetical protein
METNPIARGRNLLRQGFPASRGNDKVVQQAAGEMRLAATQIFLQMSRAIDHDVVVLADPIDADGTKAKSFKSQVSSPYGVRQSFRQRAPS